MHCAGMRCSGDRPENVVDAAALPRRRIGTACQIPDQTGVGGIPAPAHNERPWLRVARRGRPPGRLQERLHLGRGELIGRLEGRRAPPGRQQRVEQRMATPERHNPEWHGAPRHQARALGRVGNRGHAALNYLGPRAATGRLAAHRPNRRPKASRASAQIDTSARASSAPIAERRRHSRRGRAWPPNWSTSRSAQIKAITVPDLYILRADEVSSQTDDLAELCARPGAGGQDLPHMPNSGRCRAHIHALLGIFQRGLMAAMIADSTASFGYHGKPNADSARMRAAPSRCAVALILSISGHGGLRPAVRG